MPILNLIASIFSALIKGTYVQEIFIVLSFVLIGFAYFLIYENRRLYKRFIFSELLKQQMLKVEETIINFKKILIENYMSLKAEIVGKEARINIMNDRDVHHYDFVLFRVMMDLKDRIRFFFHENHLAEMTETEFNMHIDERAELIANEFTEKLDMYYYFDSSPTRVELYDSQDKLRSAGLEMIKKSFREGRKLAIDFGTRKGRKKYSV